jgi:hypothetical protein
MAPTAGPGRTAAPMTTAVCRRRHATPGTIPQPGGGGLCPAMGGVDRRPYPIWVTESQQHYRWCGPVGSDDPVTVPGQPAQRQGRSRQSPSKRPRAPTRGRLRLRGHLPGGMIPGVGNGVTETSLMEIRRLPARLRPRHGRDRPGDAQPNQLVRLRGRFRALARLAGPY